MPRGSVAARVLGPRSAWRQAALARVWNWMLRPREKRALPLRVSGPGWRYGCLLTSRRSWSNLPCSCSGGRVDVEHDAVHAEVAIDGVILEEQLDHVGN